MDGSTGRVLRSAALIWLAMVAGVGMMLAVVRPAIGIWPYLGLMIALGVLATGLLARWDRRLVGLLRAPWWQFASLLAVFVAVAAAKWWQVDAPVWQVVLQATFYLLGIALLEEVVFRGLIWDRLATILPGRASLVLVTAVVFQLSHLPNWLVYGVDPVTALFQFLWGVVWGALRAWTGSLVLPVWTHAMVDVIGG